jgi:glutamate N-acetyltransferase/amino-acid N-acetyltransferase
MAKGAGMIAPNMATMLALIVTDASIAAPHLQTALAQAAEATFNRIVVDGDMSTNDTLLALANGASGIRIGGPGSESWSAFLVTLTDIARELATAIVKDGEGATKFIVLHITGARTAAEAKQIGSTIATSPLVKTAFYGGDANWGRILAAAGRSGVKLEQNRLSLWYDSLQLVANGTPLNYNDAQANAIAAQPEITVKFDLGLGQAEATLWTCDLSHDYVDINGHYRT